MHENILNAPSQPQLQSAVSAPESTAVQHETISTNVSTPMLSTTSPVFPISGMVIDDKLKTELHVGSSQDTVIMPVTYSTGAADNSTAQVLETEASVVAPEPMTVATTASSAASHEDEQAGHIIKPDGTHFEAAPVIIEQNTLFTEPPRDQTILDQQGDSANYIVQGPQECRSVTTISLLEFPESFGYSTPEIQKVLLALNRWRFQFLWNDQPI